MTYREAAKTLVLIAKLLKEYGMLTQAVCEALVMGIEALEENERTEDDGR